MKKERYYVVLTHTYTPDRANPGKSEVFEKCEFVDRIKNSHRTTATVIIDIKNKSFVKNRITGSTYEQFISHLKKQHPSQWLKFSNLMVERGIMERESTE